VNEMAGPIGEDFEPLSPAHLQDPYLLFARLRSETPVAFVPELDHFVLTRHDEGQWALLISKRSLLPKAVEESRPLDRPAHGATARPFIRRS